MPELVFGQNELKIYSRYLPSEFSTFAQLSGNNQSLERRNSGCLYSEVIIYKNSGDMKDQHLINRMGRSILLSKVFQEFI